MRDNATYVTILIWSMWLITLATGQHTVANVTLTELLFSSPGYTDGLLYGLNSARDYRFQTYYPNHTLLLTVKEFEMEPADKNNDCLYDKVTIYNGYNESSPILETLCGSINASTSYPTDGDTVYIVFLSDDNIAYKGFQMSVVSDGVITTSTTTTTTTTTTTPTSTTTTATTPAAPTTSTSTTPAPTPNHPASTPNQQQSNGGDSDTSYTTWVIVGCCLGGAVLILVVVVAIYIVMKGKRPTTPSGSNDQVTKRVLWSRSNTVIQPIAITKTSVPPGEIVQTNIFEMDLPTADGKANLLPPLSSTLDTPSTNIMYGNA